ncbi:GGDEF domain-containing protein [Candidatus Methylospira mobilis]|uniref:GGDEF domain-containing protein n=1 Tax=Candidatus Methylospira mobilis TaxID=1808979 RepID=UPI0028F0783E|nr:GGDEF domain-containing protein [Candidatus Methylospira mobilis]WNV05001.1 GGDEF domain-containing protein [Candidatus Methylospira mobilis]
MESFRWDKHFETGLSDVDDQHHRLVDLINRFGDILNESGSVLSESIDGVLDELAAYTEYHFTEEETMMAEVGVDERHVTAQSKAHAAFLDEISAMRGGVTHDIKAAENLLKFLTHWLAYHILGTDQAMARQVAAIQGGMPPAEAYDAEERFSTGAMEPILVAMDGLFHQVTERNRNLAELNLTLEAKVQERTQALFEANQRLVSVISNLEAEKEESQRLSRELSVANRQLEAMAMTDILTGLPNRRHAAACLEQEWGAAVWENIPLVCIMIDADGFKDINDLYGHDAGDVVLTALAEELKSAVRNDDIVCRIGGDEFLIICPRTALEGGMQVAAQVRLAVAAMRVKAGLGTWLGSISVGVAEFRNNMESFNALLNMADDGLYQAKRDGRNRVASVQV